MSIFANLKNKLFPNTTELIAYLNQQNFIYKVDNEEESIYILDTSNPSRQRSREYKLKETDGGYLYLNEI